MERPSRMVGWSAWVCVVDRYSDPARVHSREFRFGICESLIGGNMWRWKYGYPWRGKPTRGIWLFFVLVQLLGIGVNLLMIRMKAG